MKVYRVATSSPAAPKWLISSNEVTFAHRRQAHNGPRCENGSGMSKKKKETASLVAQLKFYDRAYRIYDRLEQRYVNHR